MIPKRILVPARLRHPPDTGWSWVDRRFVREHMAYLSREAVLLYFFLSAVADKHGLSFYGDGTLATLLRITPPALVQTETILASRVGSQWAMCGVNSQTLTIAISISTDCKSPASNQR